MSRSGIRIGTTSFKQENQEELLQEASLHDVQSMVNFFSSQRHVRFTQKDQTSPRAYADKKRIATVVQKPVFELNPSPTQVTFGNQSSVKATTNKVEKKQK